MRSRYWMTTAASVGAILALVSALIGVLKSDLFVLRVVEISGLPSPSPVSAERILELSQIKVDESSLFEVNLGNIRSRITEEPWVESVLLERKFPHTLSVQLHLRRPIALEQNAAGALRYMDRTANSYAPFEPEMGYLLPVLVGIPEDRLARAITFLKTWEEHNVRLQASISQMTWDRERGFRTLIRTGVVARMQRSWLELGDLMLENDTRVLLDRLINVLSYVDQHQFKIQNIFADLDKKMVVRLEDHP